MTQQTSKMTKAQRAALQIVANANATGVNATRWNAGCFEGERGIGGMYYCVSIAIADKLEAMGMIKREGHMQIRITDAGRAALGIPVETIPAPTQAKAAKLSAPMIAALKETALPGRQGRCYEASTGTMKALVARGLFVWADKSGTFEDIADITAAGIVVRDGLENSTATPAPVEVKPAPVASTPRLPKSATAKQAGYQIVADAYVADGKILWRVTVSKDSQIVHTSDTHLSTGGALGFGRIKIDEILEGEVVTPLDVKPTTSPALVETGERVIAVKPMELPVEFVVAGNRHLRVTTHHAGNGAIWTIETLESFSGTWDAEPHGYANREQLNNAIAQITRESAPAITVKPARYSPCALTIQWQTLPLLPAPVVKPEAPRPADVRVSYKCHDIAAVYGVAGADSWTVYSDGPIVRKGVYTRFHSAESAIAAAKATIDTKAAAGIKKGMRGL